MQYFCVVVFFFKQKTAYEMRISDWSSDVCSSDLLADLPLPKRSKPVVERRFPVRGREIADAHGLPAHRADQAHALLDAAVVVHAAGRGDAHGGAVGDGVDDQLAMVPERDPVGLVQ